MDAEIVELLREIDAAEKEVDDLIASQKAETKNLDAGHRIVAHQVRGSEQHLGLLSVA
jgi:hypothetical protein